VLDQAVVDRLAEGSDETDPYFGVSCLGNTGSGKSFILGKLLEKIGCTELPFTLDYGSSEDGYCPISITGGLHCFRKGNHLYFDVEGTGGTLPLAERVKMGIMDRLRITEDEAQLQHLRKQCVEKFFPPLAYVTSNVIVYITREPLNCDASNEAIIKFTSACCRDTAGVRPALVLIHNFCPLQHLRRGEAQEAKFTEEYLSTFDTNGLLRGAFSVVKCMTFPDSDAYDKKKKLDGEEVFKDQLDHLLTVIRDQCTTQNVIRQRRLCALSPRALFRIMPILIEQLQMGKQVSIPEILTVQMKNNPDPDCLLLKGIFNGIVEVLAKTWQDMGEERYGKLVSCAMRLAFAVSARYLMYKFRKEDKISLPNEWITEQTDNLFEKLKQYFTCVFCTCNAVYPGTENSQNPVRCLQKYVGHDTHMTCVPVVPKRFNFLHRAVLNLFGGIRDRWEGEFTLHPTMQTLFSGSLQTVMREHALEAAAALRINAAADASEPQPATASGPVSANLRVSAAGSAVAPAAGGSSSSTTTASRGRSNSMTAVEEKFFDKFREQSLKYVFQCVDELGKEHLVISKRYRTETPETSPFCVTCFQPVNRETQCLLMCQGCKQMHIEMLGREVVPEDKACSICYENTKEYILMPCGHHGVCGSCKGSIRTCPWCRSKVESCQKVFET